MSARIEQLLEELLTESKKQTEELMKLTEMNAAGIAAAKEKSIEADALMSTVVGMFPGLNLGGENG